MKTTLLLLTFFSLLFCQSTKGMPYDTTIFPIEKEFFEGDFVVLDSLLFDVADDYVRAVNHHLYLSELSDFLEARPEWTVSVYVLMNTNYDTTSNHFLRTRASDVHQSLIYFNASPSQFYVKDSVVTNFDKTYSNNQAFRKTIVEFKEKVDLSNELKDLEEAYEQNNHQYFAFLFSEMNRKQVALKQTPRIPVDIDSFQIVELINKFYERIYQPKQNDSYKILPLTYEIEIGLAKKYAYKPEYITVWDIIFAGPEGVTTIPHTFHRVTYQPLLSNSKSIYLTEKMRRVLVEYLGYEFTYDLDEMRNIPSNIKPKGTTKKKLNGLKKYIQPEYEYLYRGACNAHVFWDFNWDFQDSFTPKTISIDAKKKVAFIEFKDGNRRIKYAQFDYTIEGWQLVEIFGNDLIRPILRWKYLLAGSLCLFWLAMISVKLVLVFSNKLETKSTV